MNVPAGQPADNSSIFGSFMLTLLICATFAAFVLHREGFFKQFLSPENTEPLEPEDAQDRVEPISSFTGGKGRLRKFKNHFNHSNFSATISDPINAYPLTKFHTGLKFC